MVTNQPLDNVFGALADPTRRVILEQLMEGEATVGELARPFEMSRPAVSKHLRVLERAGLVDRRIEGRTTRCSLKAQPMREAAEWVERYRDYWEGQLDRFAAYLESDKSRTENVNPSDEDTSSQEKSE